MTAEPLSPEFVLPADLRAWQRDALLTYLQQSPRDFTAVATPGAGKTRFALVLAQHLLRSREVARLTIVTPLPKTNGISEALYQCENCGMLIKRTLPRP